MLYLSGGMPTIVIRVFPCICIKEHNFFPNPTTEVLDIDKAIHNDLHGLENQVCPGALNTSAAPANEQGREDGWVRETKCNPILHSPV